MDRRLFSIHSFRYVLPVIGAITLSVFSNAHAQSSASKDADASEEKSDVKLEELVVTASRVSKDLQVTSIAVSAYSELALEERSINNVRQLHEEVPGIVIVPETANSRGVRVGLRGAHQETAGFRSQGILGVYIDNFVQPLLNGAFFDFYDVAQVEMLRGPQGTLYGRNSSGGAIKLTTRRPSFDWTGSLELGAGNWEQEKVNAYLSGPIVDDKLAFALSGFKTYTGGMVYALVPQRKVGAIERQGGRVKFLYTPTDRLELELGVSKIVDDSEPRPGMPLTVLPGINDPYAVPGRSLEFTEMYPGTVSTMEFLISSLNATYTVSDLLQIKSISGYGEEKDSSEGTISTWAWPDVTRNDGSPVPIGSNNDGSGENSWWSQELDFVFQSKKLSGIVGLYYFKQEGNSRSFNALSTVSDGDHSSEAPAIFADGTYWITDSVSLTAGARYTRETTGFYQFSGTAAPPQVGKSTFSQVTPKIGVNWQVKPSLFAYASITDGWRGGGFNARHPFTGEPLVNGYAPEEVRSYEVGLKYQTEDRRFRLNTALYYAHYDHIHQPVYVLYQDVNYVVTIPNAPMMAKGIESEMSWQVFDSLNVYGTLAINDGKYLDSFICSDEHLVLKDCSDKKVKGLIPVKSNVGFRFSPSIAALPGQLALNMSWAHNDKYYNNIANELPEVQTAANDLFNARLSWTDDDGHWKVAVDVRNLTDKNYIQAGLQTANAIQPGVNGYPNPRRTILGSIEYSF